MTTRKSSAARRPRASMADNTFGRGHASVPVRLRDLGRFVNGWKTIKHEVLPSDGGWPEQHLLTTAVTLNFSMTVRDLEALQRLGLVRVQCNERGTLTLYFEGR